MTTASADIRRRLMVGEPLTSQQVAEEYGLTKSVLGQVVNELAKEGVKFTRTPLKGMGNPKQYQRTGTPDAGEWGKSDDVVRRGNTKAKPPKKAKAPTPAKPRPPKPKRLDHPVPNLGDIVQVSMLALNPEGLVRMLVRNGEHAWTAEIVGYYAEKEEMSGGN